MEQHEQFLIKISFNVCDGMKDKVLDEMKDLLKNAQVALDHASNVKIKVERIPLE